MSVLIKDFEMPKSCYDCPLCYDMMECPVSGISFYKKEMEVFDFCTERHPNCLLVPIRSHGRLIDADAFVRDNGIKEIPEYFEIVCSAPTVLDAEED